MQRTTLSGFPAFVAFQFLGRFPAIFVEQECLRERGSHVFYRLISWASITHSAYVVMNAIVT